jgi:hypothetical protein
MTSASESNSISNWRCSSASGTRRSRSVCSVSCAMCPSFARFRRRRSQGSWRAYSIPVTPIGVSDDQQSSAIALGSLLLLRRATLCVYVGRVAATRERQHSSDARFGTRLRASVSVGPARSQLVFCGPVRGAGERACLWRFPGFDPPLVSSCLDADAMRRAGLPRNALGLMLRPQADSSRMLRFFTSNSVSIRFRVRRISRPRCARARRGSRAIPRAGRRGARP